MKNTKKPEEITGNKDKINPKEQVQETVSKISNNQPKEKDREEFDEVLNKIEPETKVKDVNTLETPIIDSDIQKDIKKEQIIKDKKKKKRVSRLEVINIALTLGLVVVSFLQYKTYNRQADIAANANKLSQYQYRFEFYKKLEDLQKEVSVIKKKPQLDIDEFSKLNFKILSLLRESELLFDKNISNDINKILDEHLVFLTELNNKGMYYNDYKEKMNKLNTEYGNFINSDNFKKYLDINGIQ